MNLSEDGVALTDNFEEARVVVGSFNARFESQWTRIDGRNKLDSPVRNAKHRTRFIDTHRAARLVSVNRIDS